MANLTITLIGGPTALIAYGGFRVVIDPTFDPPGDYKLPYTTLTKTVGPALSADALGPVDAVLVSHDQHWDNLDHSGRNYFLKAKHAFTTKAGAARLGGSVAGLAPWESTTIRNAAGQTLTITATPARHGPAWIEPLSGDVIGFVLSVENLRSVYATGDTTWFDGTAEVAKRFDVGAVLPFAGAAQTRGPFNLTMNTNDVIETAKQFRDAAIIPVHSDSWAHLTQTRADIAAAFTAMGIETRLKMLLPGVATAISL
ncbi:MAG TPA: MBL fold metallo-hydrolase [Rhizomicrobium sp.]|jgi:L-ascorbate metabolism protein UlaG (beta-lactamase superfamily)